MSVDQACGTGGRTRSVVVSAVLVMVAMCVSLMASVPQAGAIVNGNPAAPGVYPWMVRLGVDPANNGLGFCGGTLIAPQWVLTAGHCNVTTGTMVQIGGTRLNANTAEYRSVTGVVRHPRYQRLVDGNGVHSIYDVELLRLSAPSKIAPVRLVEPGDPTSAGTQVRIAGWGGTNNSETQQWDLRHGFTNIISDGEANEQWGDHDEEIMLATRRNAGTCAGDSGGPLLVDVGGELRQAGVTSYGSGSNCADTTIPSIFARVDHGWMRNWIDTIVPRNFSGHIRKSMVGVTSNLPNLAIVNTNTSGAANSLVRTAVGRYRAVFPNLGTWGGVAHASAIGTKHQWCKVGLYGGTGPNSQDEFVDVVCYNAAGVESDVEQLDVTFRRNWLTRAGSSMGYVLSTKPVPPSNYQALSYEAYNSSRGSVLINRTGLGQYRVTFGGLGTGDWGTSEATAYGYGSAYCNSGGFAPSGNAMDVYVNCYTAYGAPADSQFTVTYLKHTGGDRTGEYAYVLNGNPVADNTPSPTFQSSSFDGKNWINRLAVGHYRVRIPGMGLRHGSVRTTATNGSAACVAAPPAPSAYSMTVEVRCFLLGGGQPVDRGFTLVYEAPPLKPREDSDFSGDGKKDLTYYDPATKTWNILNSGVNSTTKVTFGEPTDLPVPADYDGDGRTDVAVWRPSDGGWYVIWSSTGEAKLPFFHGHPGDYPVPGDYDGDGRADPAVLRRDGQGRTFYNWVGTTGIWGGKLFTGTNNFPVPGDYDADGRTDPATWAPVNGTWWLPRSTWGDWFVNYGRPDDRAVNGDFDGDGWSDPAIYRPATRTWHYMNSASASEGDALFSEPSDNQYVRGDVDGDRKTDILIYRPSEHAWYVTTIAGAEYRTQFGAWNAKPIR